MWLEPSFNIPAIFRGFPVTPRYSSLFMAAASPPARLVGLNVGGVVFVTTSATLSSRGPNFFTAMLENDVEGRCVARFGTLVC